MIKINSYSDYYMKQSNLNEEKVYKKQFKINAIKINVNKTKNKTDSFDSLKKILKQKDDQNKILGRIQERQKKYISDLKERFDTVKKEVEKYTKDNSKILDQFKGKDSDVDNMLNGKVSAVLNSMDHNKVSEKFKNLIDSLDKNNPQYDENKNVLDTLRGMYSELYGIRETAKSYLKESQKQIDSMKNKMETYNNENKQLLSMDLMNNGNKLNKKNNKTKNNMFNINQNNKGSNNKILDSDNKKNKETLYKAYKSSQDEDKKDLRHEQTNIGKQIKSLTSNLSDDLKKRIASDKDLQLILSGNLSKIVKENSTIDDVKGKLKSLLSKTDNVNDQENILKLGSKYSEYYESKDEMRNFEKTEKKNLEDYKKKVNNYDTKKFSKNDKNIKISMFNPNDDDDNTLRYDPNTYYDLKDIVDSMYM